MNVLIEKSNARGITQAIPSKSYLHRILIASFLCFDDVKVENIYYSDDPLATIISLQAMGAKISIEGNTVYFSKADLSKKDISILCLQSASTMRFLIPIILKLYPDTLFEVLGAPSLIDRGIDVYLDLFEKCGIYFEESERKYDVESQVLSLKGYKIKGRLDEQTYYIRGDKSSQYISGLIFACCLDEKDTRIVIEGKVESRPYIDITIDVLKRYGMEISFDGHIVDIKGGREFYPHDEFAEGDYSAASFISALNYMSKENKVEVLGLNPNSMQGDKVYKKYFDMLYSQSPIIDVSDCIDLAPIMFALASHLNGARFINTQRLRLKESDRVKSMQEELVKFGANISVLDNEVVISKSKMHTPNDILNGHEDHRIIMALSILCTYYGGTIENVEYVDKSYPNFFDDLSSLGIKIEKIGELM